MTQEGTATWYVYDGSELVFEDDIYQYDNPTDEARNLTIHTMPEELTHDDVDELLRSEGHLQ